MKHSAFASYDEKMKNESSGLHFPGGNDKLPAKRSSPMQKSNNKLADISVAFAVEILDLVNI